MKKYAVTGIGIVNGLGSNLQENWSNLIAGKSAIKELVWPEDNNRKFPKTHKSCIINTSAPTAIPEFEEMSYGGMSQYWDPCVKLAMRTVEDALADSQLTSKNVAVVYSSAAGQTVTRAQLTRAIEDGKERISPRLVIQATADYISGAISRYNSFNGLSTGVIAACCTGLLSLDFAIKTLEQDEDLDAAIVGGADALFEAYQCFYFQNLGALSSQPAEIASRPFDKNRSGFVAGEGAGCMILEPLEKALKRNAKIYATVNGIGIASAGHHETSPDKDGIAAKTAALRALRSAKLETEQVDFINAHATGTILGDEIEFYAMKELFPGKVMTANKGQIGHSLAASGIVESIYTIMSLKYQIAPPTINLENPIDVGMFIPTRPSTISAKYAIKNNFAFSGRSVCAVFERYEG